jgi:multiple sugar transport system substrate-binding protein
MKKSTTAKIAAVVAATGLLLAGCAPSTGGDTGGTTGPVSQADIDKAMNTPTTISFWNWVPDVDKQVAMFEKKYPKIKVKYTNVGRGDVQYQKLRTAIKAGSGAPDVAMIEYQYLPSFENQLLDLTPYGAEKVKDQYVSTIWSQVAKDGKVLAYPQDMGPMGNLYRSDVFAAAGVDAPKTWDEFAKDAQTIKDKTGNYIADLPGGDPGQFVGLLWQAGARPFGYDGKKTVTIDLQSAETKKVVDYWDGLIQKGLVDTQPDFTDDWFHNLDTGKYASWQTAAWAPDVISASASGSVGKWTAAPLPNWEAGKDVSAFWGGSTNGVLKSSKNPIVAAEFAKFIDTDPEATLEFATSSQSLYPPQLDTLNDPKFSEQKSDFFGGQQVNKLFGEITKSVDPSFQWLPFMDYAYSSFNDTLGKAIADKTALEPGLKAWQDKLVAYAKQQGYTVKTS